MSTEENRAIVGRYIDEVWNQRNLDLLSELFDPDYTVHQNGQSTKINQEALRQGMAMAQVTFPDLHMSRDVVIAEGDKVVAHWLTRGTQKGELRLTDLQQSMRATDRPVAFTEAVLFRIVNSKIKDGWYVSDRLSMMQQVGLVGPIGSGVQATVERPPMPEPPTVIGGRMASPEEGKALMRRLIDGVWNEANVELADEIFHPKAVSPSAPQLPPGPEGVKAIVTTFRSAFPDFHITIEDLVAEENSVAARLSETGTHKGEFMGIAPTGRQVQFEEIGILRVGGGKVVESWYETDMLGLMQQLGVLRYTTSG